MLCWCAAFPRLFHKKPWKKLWNFRIYKKEGLNIFNRGTPF